MKQFVLLFALIINKASSKADPETEAKKNPMKFTLPYELPDKN